MRKLFQKTLFLSLLGASIPGAANAEVCEGLAAELVSHLLPAQVQRSKQQQWQDLQADDVYCVGDKVRVGENGQVYGYIVGIDGRAHNAGKPSEKRRGAGGRRDAWQAQGLDQPARAQHQEHENISV